MPGRGGFPPAVAAMVDRDETPEGWTVLHQIAPALDGQGINP